MILAYLILLQDDNWKSHFIASYGGQTAYIMKHQT